MKKVHVVKFFAIILMFFLISSSFVYVSNAGEQMIKTLQTVDEAQDSTNATKTVRSVLGTILVAVQIVAMTVAVVILLVLAMKYMAAAPGEKADIKKSFFVYVVGAVVVFGAIGILRVIEMASHAIG